MSYLSENLRFWRKQKGLSQEKFSSELGINRGKLASYEESVEPRQEFLFSLVNKFNVNLHLLLTRPMTHGTFDSFFLTSESAVVHRPVVGKKTAMIEKLMIIKTTTSEERMNRLADELILDIAKLMEENHELREELLILLKQIRK